MWTRLHSVDRWGHTLLTSSPSAGTLPACLAVVVQFIPPHHNCQPTATPAALPPPPHQALFPGSDVARMVELAPAAFLDGDWPPKAQQLEAASSLLRRELCGADLDFMFQVGEMDGSFTSRTSKGKEDGVCADLAQVGLSRDPPSHCIPPSPLLQEDPAILFEPLDSLQVGPAAGCLLPGPVLPFAKMVWLWQEASHPPLCSFCFLRFARLTELAPPPL